MDQRQLKAIEFEPATTAELKFQLEEARRDLLVAEAELAEEQAAVNAFRMHCRLKLDQWVDRLMEAQTRNQSLLTRLELLRQAKAMGLSPEASDDFWRGEESFEPYSPQEDETLILPTDTPRDKAAEKRIYRQLARKFHPDLGATTLEVAYRTELMTAVNAAYAEGDVQTLYDLADEPDPGTVAAIKAIESQDARKLRQQIVRMKRRTRRAQRRLSALREENTARLWQKAKKLDQHDVDWWEMVRREIERAIEKLSAEEKNIRSKLEPFET